ncbi:class I SAM-dependent methyltransferase [Bacillus manliponensis]|uniref:class I SAM-dependent methyltransferase n=1 Tax=Bacillus manliponensis TaxID=574376 RepID=UPI00068F8D82|nr:class I SAM-dependent methyltransferase [Bacillus manliponensis]
MKNEFTNKAKEYAIGRPTYPEEIINKLKELGIGEQSIIADIGAGTGLLTQMLCKLGCSVLAIEPNLDMLNECKRYCSTNTNIEYIHAPAERTHLKDHSVDIITIAQAFHWFDKQLCKTEFQRILKKNGYVIILWNDMQADSEFTQEYINTVYKYKVKTTAGISNFDPDKEKFNFFGKDYIKLYYDNWQPVTVEGVIGSALSLSYTPSNLDSNYDEFVQELHNLFLRHQKNGKVTFHYKTEVCICQFI